MHSFDDVSVSPHNKSLDFDHKNDNEIITLINSGHDEGVDYLLNKYKNLVIKKSRALYLIGGDADDLIQEGMIGLYRAIKDFDVNKGYSFIAFASLCIERQLYNAIKHANSLKNTPLNTYVSLYMPVSNNTTKNSNGGGTEKNLSDVLKSDSKSNPETLLIHKENVNILEQAIEEALSPLERNVVNMYLDGYKISLIAKEMDKTPKSVDNALQRAKKKLVAHIR